MNEVAAVVRFLLRGSDKHLAADDDNTAVAGALAASSAQDPAAVRHFCKNDPGGVVLGELADVDEERLVTVAADRLFAHWSITGPSGVGKTFYLLHLRYLSLLRGIPHWLFDVKGETYTLTRRLILEYADRLPPREADDLLSKIVCVDLFSTDALPCLIDELGPGDDPEVVAWSLASVWLEATRTTVGVVQEAVWHRPIECLLRAHESLLLLPYVYAQPEILDQLASRSDAPAVFHETAARLRSAGRERLNSLIARCERLLRLGQVRRMLVGRQARSFDDLLAGGYSVLVNLAAPAGAPDLTKFAAGLLWLRLARAILRRPEGGLRVLVALEEFPQFLSGSGPAVANSVEELLRLARSRRVFLQTLQQDMASVSAISSILPTVLTTNAGWVVLFRSSEGFDWSWALPTTGRRLKRPPCLPWEEARVASMSASEEATVLRQELARLPSRTAYLVDRHSGLAGIKIRTPELKIPGRTDLARLDAKALEIGFVQRVADLARAESRIRERARTLAEGEGSHAEPAKDPLPSTTPDGTVESSAPPPSPAAAVPRVSSPRRRPGGIG
ncbi:MAG: hypothetical protein WBV96_18525 [Polyangia bacterium]